MPNNTISENTLDELKQFIITMTQASGAIIQKYFRGPYQVNLKTDQSPVTIADRDAEACMRQHIMQHYPEHGILGEEYGQHNPKADWQWILDPVDGTKSFICGSFDFGSIIGLTYQGQPVLGAIHQPVLKELFIGDNHTTTFNGNLIHVKKSGPLNDAVLVTSDLLNIGDYKEVKGFDNLCKQIKLARTWGNCFGYSLLAMGYVDIMIDPKPEKWDKIGIIPIIRGAGGIVTDYHGNDPVAGDSIVASHPTLHEQVITILNET